MTKREFARDPIAVRIFVADDKTGAPIAGVPVSVWAEEEASSPVPSPPDATPEVEAAPAARRRAVGFPANPPQTRFLASLQTDAAGYASFKFDRTVADTSTRLSVMYGVSPKGQHSFAIPDLLAGSDTVFVRLDAATIPAPQRTGLPSVMAPDARDLELSPSSIGLTPQLVAGDLCRQLTPTVQATRRFRVVRVMADICRPEAVICGKRRVEVVKGTLFEYEVVWYPGGTSLGELLNTITLAPCEQINVAISDWTRNERASVDETSDVRQVSTADMSHERLIFETMNSATSTDALTWGVGLGIAGPVKGFTTSLSGGVAGTATTAQIAASTSSQLSDRVSQAASFVASRRSSVVFQSTATERNVYRTGTIRNHNHCHTLTLVYYQVNRAYHVVTDYLGSRDVLLVRAPAGPFDAYRAYSLSGILKPMLLDPALAGAFDELAEALFCCELKPAAPPAERLIDSLELRFWVEEEHDSQWWFNGTFTYAGGTQSFGGSSMQPPLHMWKPGGMYTLAVPLTTPIDPAKAVSVVLMMAGDATASFTFSKIEIVGHVAATNDTILLYSTTTDTTIETKLDSRILAWLSVPAAEPAAAPSGNECVDRSCAIQKLLGHLNSHLRYYNTAVLFHQNPNDRITQWSCCTKDDQPFDIIGQIENDPVTIHGDYVVFPILGSTLTDDPSILPESKLILVPTAGVYSEGILGQCSTCEITDPGRFWDWKESPCGDEAPAVVNPPAPQTSQTPGDLKAETITNLITLGNVPEVSSVALKDMISSLVSSADSGSTVAKDVLAKLLETVKESLKPSK